MGQERITRPLDPSSGNEHGRDRHAVSPERLFHSEMGLQSLALMGPLSSIVGGLPHCKRCRVELTGDERACPHCDYDPKQMGYRIATGGLIVLVLAVIAAQIAIYVGVPGIGMLFVLLAVISFVFAFCTFLLSMIMTPYRLGGVFKRF